MGQSGTWVTGGRSACPKRKEVCGDLTVANLDGCGSSDDKRAISSQRYLRILDLMLSLSIKPLIPL